MSNRASLSATIALTACAAAWLHAQERKPDTPSATSVVVVEGCLRGTALERLQGTTRLPGEASEWVLDGPKELIQTLKRSHNGHHLRVTGELIVPPTPANERVKVETVDLGRGGRITVGTREHAGLIKSEHQPYRIMVEGFEHLGEKCISAR